MFCVKLSKQRFDIGKWRTIEHEKQKKTKPNFYDKRYTNTRGG